MYAKPSATMYATVGLETGVAAASPHKLVDMLFDGAETAVKKALKYQSVDAEICSRAISHATNIIAEGLRGSLDHKQGGEIAARLDALYEYMTSRLIAANVSRQPEPLEEVLKLLADLHAGWREIGQSGVAAGARPAGLTLAA